MESILTSIKKLLLISDNDTSFDTDVIIDINSALSTLTQLGVGPSQGFSISDKESLWTDFLSDNLSLEMIKTFVYLDVKLVFDPPANSTVLKALQARRDEYVWRISVAASESNKGE